MFSSLITVLPSLGMEFEKANTHKRWLWDNTSNCYGYAIGHASIDAINLGSLTLSMGNNADNNKLTSSSGLQELLDRDGWLQVDCKDINPVKNHVIGVFGFRPLGQNFNEFHCFRLNNCGGFSEKLGAGRHVRSGLYCNAKQPLTIMNLEKEYNGDIAGSVGEPSFAGFYRMPDEGLKIHPRHFKRGASELLPFYPLYS